MRKKILIVDDEAINRELLRQIFEGDYDIVMAQDGQDALGAIKQYRNELAVILMDLMMPKVNGYQVLQVLSSDNLTKQIPVVLITSNTDIKVTLSCYSLGVVDIINKPFIAQIVRQRVVNVIEMFQDKETLRDLLEQSNEKLSEQKQQLEQFYNNLMDSISNLVEFRNMESGMHIKRVKGMTQILAKAYQHLYPEDGLTDEQLNTIVRASALHDIGKLVIPDAILLKPGKLNDDEREVMKSHTTRGCEILSRLEIVQDSEHYKTSYEIIRHHHERYDGNGYPDNLKGDDIPISAQLVSVVDVYDALVSERIYKKAYSKTQAYEMIMGGECGVFSDKMLKCLNYAKKVIEIFSDAYQ